MSKKYLDSNGLLYFWQKIKNTFALKSEVPAAVSPSSTTPKMDGTAAVGTENAFARGDHVHPTDTSRVPTTRTVNGHALSSNVTVSNLDLGQGYGECPTEKDTTDKAVQLSGYTLTKGGVVSIRFGNPIGNVTTLDINAKGEKHVRFENTVSTDTAPIKTLPFNTTANLIYTFVYDGTNYVYVACSKTLTTTYSGMGASEAKAGTSTASRVISAYTLHEAIADYVNEHVNQPIASIEDAAGYIRILGYDGTYYNAAPINTTTGTIDAEYLPSYVDDIIEAYARSGQTALSKNWLATGSASGTVITPEAGKIYVLMADSGNYSANSQFRWSGTAYVKLNDGGVSEITNSEIDTIVAS